jgi:hypothetical protein
VPNARRGTKLLADLFGNVIALSDWFQERLKPHFGNRFSPYIRFQPEFSRKKVEKSLRGDQEETVIFAREDRTGGSLFIYMGGKQKGSPAYISFGYWFELEGRAKRSLTGYIGSEVFLAGVPYEGWRTFKLSDSLKLPESSAQKLILHTMHDAINEALTAPSLEPESKKQLSALREDVKRLPEY